VRTHFDKFSFGTIRIDGSTYEQDVVIDRGEIRTRKKTPSKKFRDEFGHTPLSIEEKIPWNCHRLVIGTGAEEMAKKLYRPEEIVNLLRQVEVAVANGRTTEQAAREAGIVERTYYRWRREYGGLKVDQAKRLKELEQENSRLKRLVANLSLDKQVLEDLARGNF
jgi:hypothetical protein